MTTTNEMTSTDRAIRKGAIIAGVIVALVIGWFISAASAGTNEGDVVDACNSRVLEIIEDGSVDDIAGTTARESLTYTATRTYSEEWSASGVITSDYMTGIIRPIPYDCILYMDSTGNDIDGTVSIDF